MLGVLKAGGACAALDPQHPIERLQTMITDLEAEIIVSSSANVDLLKRIANTIVVVDSSSPYLLLEESQDPLRKEWRKAQSCDAAFVVFTSGSTGKPKGIVVEHTAFCTSAREHGAALQLGVDSRVLQFAAYTFDVSLGEMFTTLMHGGCICIPSEEDRLNDLAGVIQRMKVNWACLAPSVANLIFPTEVPSLKTLALSGEAATRAVVTTWADTVRLVNIYGPAECSIWSTYSGNLNKDASPTNIGQGVGSVLWVTEVANHERLVPIGCIGELLIEGPILARGYLNNREKTTEAFIENPPWAEHFGPSRRKRFYKTGDLVCYNSNGTINYVGRKDTQVKLHGQRLELGEIEHHILSNVQVINGMVMLPTKGHGKGQLVAIIAFREPTSNLLLSLGMSNDKNLRLVDMNRKKWTTDQISRIREHLSSRLPVYMLPVLWMVVEATPLNTSGKLDRVRVRRWVEEMDEEMYRRGVDINAEAGESKELITTTHRQLQKVLAKVLNLPEERIMLNQSFLSLGGDSITAMQVVARARTEGITIRVKDILQSRNILQLISVAKSGQLTSPLEENERTLGDFPLLPLTYADLERMKNEMRGTVGAAGIEEAEEIYQCTPMQQALLLGQSRMSGTYKLVYTFEVVSTQPGTHVNVNKLLSAWQSVVQRHTILRTVFVDSASLDISFEDGPFVQLVLNRVAPRTICQPIAKNDTEALASLMQKDLIDYHEAMPPHQLTICQTALGNVFCKLEISHAINDGTSTKIMLRDLNLAYHGKLPKSPAMPYRNYVKYLQDWVQDSGMQFWRERLADVKPCIFPVLGDQNQGARQLKVVDLDLDLKLGQLEALCNAAGVTVSTVLTAVWGLVLRYYTNSDDVCFGYLTSGRDIALHGIEDAVGPFINMLVCHMQIKPTSRLTDVLVQRQAEYLEALGYQHYSLARIQHELKLPSRQMFNTAISIQSKTCSHTEEDASLMFREIGGEDPVEVSLELLSYKLIYLRRHKSNTDHRR
jgi:amino acid adenylation domain-containing protein